MSPTEAAQRITSIEQFLADRFGYTPPVLLPGLEGGVPFACEVLGLSAARVYFLVSRGLPHERRSGRLWFTRADLLAYNQGRRRPAKA